MQTNHFSLLKKLKNTESAQLWAYGRLTLVTIASLGQRQEEGKAEGSLHAGHVLAIPAQETGSRYLRRFRTHQTRPPSKVTDLRRLKNRLQKRLVL